MGDTRRMAGLALASVLAFGGLAACGDDGGDDGVALEDVEGGDDGDETTTTEDSDDESSDTTIDLGDIPNLSGECEVFTEALIAFGAAFSGGESVDFGDLADAMQAAADDAPDEISDDLGVMAEAYATFAEEFGDIDFSDPEAFSDPEVQARFAEAGELFGTPEFTEASENVNAFAEANCDVEG